MGGVYGESRGARMMDKGSIGGWDLPEPWKQDEPAPGVEREPEPLSAETKAEIKRLIDECAKAGPRKGSYDV